MACVADERLARFSHRQGKRRDKRDREIQSQKIFWQAVEPGTEITLGVEISKDFPISEVRFFDGDKLIGTVNKEPWELDWSHAKIGCRAVWAEFDGKDGIGAANPALINFEPGE